MLENSARNWCDASGFDQCHVEISKGRPAKGISAQCTKYPIVRSRPARHIDRNVEKGNIIGSQSEVVFAHLATRGRVRRADLIGSIRAIRTGSGLLHARIDRERKAAGKSPNA